jgi:acetyl-CoA carboxylase biotin carboxyl carrier protein
MELDSEDIDEILQLLDDTPYEELTVRTSRFMLRLKRGGDGQWTESRRVLDDADFIDGEEVVAEEAGPETESLDLEGLHAVRASLPGTFYRAPSPGAPPFVEVGSTVEEDSVVCIIETMKLMNSIHAGVRGTVKQICRENAEYADKGAVLFVVEPEGT